MKVSLYKFNWALETVPCVANKNRWRVSFQKKEVMKLPLKKLLKKNGNT